MIGFAVCMAEPTDENSNCNITETIHEASQGILYW